MSLLLLPIGLLLSTLTGWLLLRLTEGTSPVLLRWERWVAGFVLGLLLTMFATFLLHALGLIGFTRFGFLFVQILLTGVLGRMWYKRRDQLRDSALLSLPPTAPPSTIIRVMIVLLGIWTSVKILSGSLILLFSPAYFDDVLKNWNMRGKMLFFSQKLQLSLTEGGAPEGISSYPPSVPMVKAWLSTLYGSWSDPLANAPHMLWYLSVLILVYFSLRKLLPWTWSLLGTYILSSIPLYYMHGVIPYGDGFLSLHIFLALSFLFHAVRSDDNERRMSFFRLSAVATGLLVFTKNEAILLYIPPILLILVIVLGLLRKHETISLQEVKRTLLWYAVCIAMILIPWLLFKWSHGLSFGNAKGIPTEFSWQPGVLKSVWINTFFEGNWIFLFPLLVGLVATRWRKAFLSPLGIFSAFILIVYFGQLFIYMFTGLSTEALNQTGYARGLIHLIPLIVMVVTVLVADILRKRM